MRILTIGPSLSPHLYRPVKSLLQRKHQVCLMGYYSEDPFSGENLPGYVWIEDTSGSMGVSDYHVRKTYNVLSPIISKFKPQVIHIHWISWHLPLCKQIAPDIPLVASVWGSDLNCALIQSETGYAWLDTSLSAIYAKKLSLADHLIFDDTTMFAKCAFAAPGVPAALLPLGANDIFFQQPSEEEKIRKKLEIDSKYIFTSARLLTSTYRQKEILRAFALACKDKDAALVFKDFVTDRPLLKELKYLAQKLGIMHQVKFYTGLNPEELRDLYSISASLISFPSRDAFPVTFAEAAAIGANVITCWHPSYDTDLVKECFDILPNDSVKTLANAIRSRIESPGSGDSEKRVKARKIAYEQYNHANYADKLIEIYGKLAGVNS